VAPISAHHRHATHRLARLFHQGNNLVSQFNIMGMTTINEIELAAAVLGHATQLETIPQHSYVNTYLGLDRTAAQAWLRNGFITTTNAPAKILHLFAQHCRCHNANLKPFYIEGYTNTIADLLPRSFSMLDDALLQTLQRLAPIQPPWWLVTPRAALVSTLNSILLNRPPDGASPATDPMAGIQYGQLGPTSVSPCPKTHS
jgi:hypothetical protein